MADEQQVNVNVAVSEPPDVREAKVWRATIENFAALVIVAGAWFLDKIDQWTALGSIAVILGIVSAPNMLSALGKGGGAKVGVLSLALKPAVAVAAVVGKSSTLLVLLLLLGGCGMFSSADMSTVHAQALDANGTLDAAASELNAASPYITFWCGLRGESDPNCIAGRRGHELASLSIEVARGVVRVYNDTGESYEAVQRVLVQLRRDFDDVRRVTATAKGLIDAMDRATPGQLAPYGDPRGSGASQEPATPAGGAGQPAAAAAPAQAGATP